jgi:hypothetical protein
MKRCVLAAVVACVIRASAAAAGARERARRPFGLGEDAGPALRSASAGEEVLSGSVRGARVRGVALQLGLRAVWAAASVCGWRSKCNAHGLGVLGRCAWMIPVIRGSWSAGSTVFYV